MPNSFSPYQRLSLSPYAVTGHIGVSPDSKNKGAIKNLPRMGDLPLRLQPTGLTILFAKLEALDYASAIRFLAPVR